jgi:hypothetical protein
LNFEIGETKAEHREFGASQNTVVQLIYYSIFLFKDFSKRFLEFSEHVKASYENDQHNFINILVFFVHFSDLI